MSFGYEQLGRLIAQLQGAQISAAPDQILAAHDLLLKLRLDGRMPESDAQFRALLAPLFCRSPEEQERFYRLFDGWVGDARGDEKWVTPKPEVPATPHELRARTALIRNLILAAVVVIVGYMVASRPKPVDVRTAEPGVIQSDGPASNDATPPSAGPRSTDDPILARPPERIEARAYLPGGLTLTAAQARWLVTPIPLLVLVGVAVWRVRNRRVLLSRGPSDEAPNPHRLPVHGTQEDLFATYRLRSAIDRLRAPTRVPIRQIDNRRTVDASLRSAGLFTPVYRMRRQLPEYLVLIDRAHPGDHLAAFGRALIERLRNEGLSLYVYYFHGDPRRCQEEGEAFATVSLDELESHFGRARLLLITDARRFVSPFSGKLERWTGQLSRWAVRMLLTPIPARKWASTEFSLALSGVAVAPLDGQGLSAVARWLTTAGTVGATASGASAVVANSSAPLLRGTGSSSPLPALVERHFERWREREPPRNVDVDELLAQLQAYLGEHGYRVLCALAFYPQITWTLTLYVDWRLAPAGEEGETREDRLFDLARLPWLRYSQMPDYLRLKLIRSLPPQAAETIRGLYRSLFESAEKAPRNAIELMVDDAPSDELWQRLRARFAREKKHGPYADRVFAKVLLFGQPGKLDIEVPRYLERMLPASRWQRAVVASVAALAVAVAVGMAAFLASAPLQPRLDRSLFAAERVRNASTRILIIYDPSWQAMADALGATLHDWGYGVSYKFQSIENAGDAYPPGMPEVTGSLRVLFAEPDGEPLARWIANRVGYLSYDVGPAVSVVSEPSSVTQAGRAASATSGNFPVVAVMLLSYADGGMPMVFQDRLAKGGLAPQMVTDLTGALPVAFSRTSITRDDFTQFVNATHHQVEADISAANRSGCTASNEARTPDVVCVGFDDARAYAAWLSDQTGSSYRLATRDELDAVRQAVERFPPSTVTPFTGGWTSEVTRGVGVIRADFHVVRDMPRARTAQSKSRS